MVQGLLVWVSSCVLVLFGLLGGGPALGAEASDPPGASLRAYADPRRGELVPAPPANGAGAAVADPAAPDPTELELVPAPVAAGGVMVDLRGQFLYGVRARAAVDGTVSHQCAPKSDVAAEK